MIDITGHRFGHLVALRREGRIGSYAVWICRCDCGRQKEVTTGQLRSGNTITCGCRGRDLGGQDRIDGDCAMTFEEIAQQLGVTRQAARQTFNRALRKLARVPALRELVEA